MWGSGDGDGDGDDHGGVFGFGYGWGGVFSCHSVMEQLLFVQSGIYKQNMLSGLGLYTYFGTEEATMSSGNSF